MLENKKRLLIYAAGEKLFGKFGVKKVSIDMIVQEAGVAKGTFYLSFKNKEDLYKTIIHDVIEKSFSCIDYKVNNISDLKERLIYEFLGTLVFFEKNEIFRNIARMNQDYFIGEITMEYLQNTHIQLLQQLLSNQFDENMFSFKTLSRIIGFYSYVVNIKDTFENNQEYKKFVVDLSIVIVNGLFTASDNLFKKINYDKIEQEILNKLNKKS